MARQSPFTAKLSNGISVGFSLIERNGVRYARFRHNGKLIETSTGEKLQGNAAQRANEIIEEYFSNKKEIPKSFDEIKKELSENLDIRKATRENYISCLSSLQLSIKKDKPIDVTEKDCHEFKKLQLTQPFKRTDNGVEYTRSPATVKSLIRSLRSIWNKHIIIYGYAVSNPFEKVSYPNVVRAKRVRVPKTEHIEEFLKWLKFNNGFEAINLYIEIKMLTACRTKDLCSLKKEHLNGNELLFPAELVKNKKDRIVRLPEYLAKQLEKYKGEIYLWEKSFEDGKTQRGSRYRKWTKEFNPETFQYQIESIFHKFNKTRQKADKVRPHDLRARGITLVAMATGNVDATAKHIGIDPTTARHYLDSAMAYDDADIFKRLESVLLPKKLGRAS